MRETPEIEVKKVSDSRCADIGLDADDAPIGVCIFVQASELQRLGIDPDKHQSISYNLVNISGEVLIRITKEEEFNE